jgi:AraC family transcriptional regulator, regulatory protein of adaptative response / methylated-DNA-[protein]-cysteine methyltransferase
MSSHYHLVERALHRLAAAGDEAPDLDTLAAEMGLSPSHFQRVFTEWAGVSPKRFVQFLSLERARASLDDNASVLDAAFAAGLSSPGRLHDLFVACEGVTPGEYRRRGAGLDIRYGWASSPFGEALALTTARGLCGMTFVGDEGRDETLSIARARWSAARFVEDDEAVRSIARQVFERTREPGERLTLSLHGTPWQIKVWEALLRIPPGALVSYDQIAASLGAPKASRAVGTAIAENPIGYVIPCHRVIRKTGAIHQYRWGRARKMAMIGWEAAQRDAQ